MGKGKKPGYSAMSKDKRGTWDSMLCERAIAAWISDSVGELEFMLFSFLFFEEPLDEASIEKSPDNRDVTMEQWDDHKAFNSFRYTMFPSISLSVLVLIVYNLILSYLIYQ
jgi:hypothetical protein